MFVQVIVSIISETQANLLLSDKQTRGDASGEILNNKGIMEYDSTTKQLSITFRYVRSVPRFSSRLLVFTTYCIHVLVDFFFFF